MIGTFLKEYFSFTTSQRNGIIVLVILIILVSFVPKFYKSFIYSPGEVDPEIEKDFNKFKNSLVLNSTDSVKENKVKPFILAKFDPNFSTKNELVELGIPEKTANTIINFRKKGGKFYDKKDLKKIYGLHPDLYSKLEPYINIKKRKTYETKLENNIKTVRIEINSSDSIQLVSLPGIGPKLSQRIIKYRKMLGGFYNISQLKEVYGISDSVIKVIENKIIVDTNQITKIDINKVTKETPIRHPYLNKYQSYSIIKFKQIRGSYITPNDLVENSIIPTDVYQKVRPYLK